MFRKSIFAILAYIALIATQALGLHLFWGWFIVAPFHFPTMPYVTAIGLILLITIILKPLSWPFRRDLYWHLEHDQNEFSEEATRRMTKLAYNRTKTIACYILAGVVIHLLVKAF